MPPACPCFIFHAFPLVLIYQFLKAGSACLVAVYLGGCRQWCAQPTLCPGAGSKLCTSGGSSPAPPCPLSAPSLALQHALPAFQAPFRSHMMVMEGGWAKTARLFKMPLCHVCRPFRNTAKNALSSPIPLKSLHSNALKLPLHPTGDYRLLEVFSEYVGIVCFVQGKPSNCCGSTWTFSNL